MLNHSHIRHFSSVFVSLRDFQLITQNSSENIASRQSRCIYVNETAYHGAGLKMNFELLNNSSEASPTFGHANANFSVFLTV